MSKTFVIKAFFLILVLIFSTNNCSERQQNRTISTAASPSTATEDIVYFADASGQIHALQTNGAEKWRYSIIDDLARQLNGEKPDIRIERLIARSGKKLFGLASLLSGSKAGETILFALDENKLLWLEPVSNPEANGAPIAIGNEAIYLAGDEGVLYAFRKDNGQLLWRYQVSKGTIGAPLIGIDGTIYVTGPRHNLHAIGADGKQKWIVETEPSL